MNKIFGNKGILILGLIVLAELFSVFTLYVPFFNNSAVLLIAVLALVLTLYRLDYGVLLLLVELFIGSKGYLFYFESQGVQVSLRIILWLIVMTVWLVLFVSRWLKDKKFPWPDFQKFPFIWALGALAFFVVIGLLNGFLRGHDFSNLFFDFNGWLFFLLLLPFYDVFIISQDKKRNWERLEQILVIVVLWLSVKTLLLLYFFTHNIPSILPDLYRWVRLSGVGEITPAPGGFFRIFFQSHIFLLLASPFLIWRLRAKKSWSLWILLVLCWAGIIVSMSRSFWLALLASLFLMSLLVWKREGIKAALIDAYKYVVILVLSLILVLAIVKFPFPPVSGSFNLSLFADRANLTQDESAISSRWALLDSLKTELFKSPIIGSGFGALVTYKSSDPRVAETTADKMYTTYAFEWGWLDVWLKLGLFGFLAYLYLLFLIIQKSWKSNIALASSIVALMAANIFTPYANHPLGIAWIMLLALWVYNYQLEKK
ncbi:MAG: O-antigen ligase family protein [Candidatus Falkowbacteria bacterium]